jgi:hypothetical protein
MKTSDTALEQYQKCPFQYKLERIDHKKGNPNDKVRVGRVCHRTLKQLMRDHIAQTETKPLDYTSVPHIFEEEWEKEVGLSDRDLFTEGMQMVNDTIDSMGEVDPKTVVGIEKPFSIEFDGVTLIGSMDLVFKYESTDSDTGEVTTEILVIDYKSTLAFLTSRDARESLQLQIYNLAARELWPDATTYRCALFLMASAQLIPATWTVPYLADTKKYIVSTCHQIENEKSWHAHLNSDCVYCHHRHDCGIYRDALIWDDKFVCESLADLDSLAKEREDLTVRLRILNRRKDEVDNAIKSAVRSGPLEIDGELFKLSRVETKTYPLWKTIQAITKHAQIDVDKIIDSIATVSKSHLDSFLRDAETKLGASKVTMIRAALDNVAQREISTRLYHKAGKEHAKNRE